MIDCLLPFVLELASEIAQAIGFRNYQLWSNTHSASSRQLWTDERQPLTADQQQEQEQEHPQEYRQEHQHSQQQEA